MTDWSQIVHQYGAVVWASVHRLVSHQADAADCFQCTFLSALQLSRTESVRNWPGLLKRLATVQAIECLRRRRREADRLRTLSEDSLVDHTAIESSRVAEANELAEHLREALAELDQRQATVFCLAHMEDQSYQQIAEGLGITVNHVGVLLNRARASLRERLRAHAPDPVADRVKREG